ncbi:hypothetical protein [Moraxella bovoculi]|uniref:hypothetical protein n=1 Tax=Moraxella bovoculi TaxID=386891 RepID=UPI0013C2ABAA|nr:hypothetical protein [Moraxella bovoculi]
MTGCASLTPPKQMQARIIKTTHNNITTTPRVSSLSNSILLASGLTQDSYMADFDACLNDLRSAFFGDQFDREGLVLLAELHYTQALHLAEKMECKPALNRPLIYDYYANAPIDEETKQAQAKACKDCLEGHRDTLYKTIAFSYGYLFFDSLTNQNTQKPIITDSDIRAQDLYHVSLKHSSKRSISSKMVLLATPINKTKTSSIQHSIKSTSLRLLLRVKMATLKHST